MSTVLRPVGPQEPRVYWLRRAVLITLVLVLIVVVAKACSGGGGGSGDNKTKAGHHPSASVSPSTTPSTSSPAVAPCDPTALTLTLTTDSKTNTFAEGQGAKFIGTFHNPGASACTFTFAPANEDWLVMSGPAKVWTTEGCTSSTLTKDVTINAGGHKKVSVTWDGKAQGANCADSDTAKNGEYTLTGTLDSIKGNTVVFHVSPPT
jgi:hypothetical protein